MAPEHDLPLEEYHRAGREITNGKPEVYKRLYSRRGDVTLANPFGPPVRGWSEVSATLDRAAENYRDGEVVGFENVSTGIGSDLAYTVEVESYRARVGGAEEILPVGGSGHDHLSARGGHLEGGAQARRPDHRAASAEVRNPDIAPRPPRTPRAAERLTPGSIRRFWFGGTSSSPGWTCPGLHDTGLVGS